MKKHLYFLFFIAICFASFFLCAQKGLSAEDNSYPEVESVKLRAAPEQYMNKRISYISRYKGFETTFRDYVERSGFKPGRHYLILIVPISLPVMGEKKRELAFVDGKKQELNDFIPTLKPGSYVKVSGRIKRYNAEPLPREANRVPRYYLDLDKIEPSEPPADAKDADAEEEKEDKTKDNKQQKQQRKEDVRKQLDNFTPPWDKK